jgi:hypothetical protein
VPINDKAKVQLTTSALSVPQQLDLKGVKNWAEYAIWGLALHQEQLPWLALVEFIQICAHKYKTNAGKGLDNPIFDDSPTLGPGKASHEQFSYSIRANMLLRHLVFRDEEIDRVRNEISAMADPMQMWDLWVERTNAEWKGLIPDGYVERIRQYVPEGFEGFATAIDLLRGTEVEAGSRRRMTSRHLLPLGPAMLFSDVNLRKDNKLEYDRRFMRRTGEIVWLMVNRSASRGKVGRVVQQRFFQQNDILNRIAERLGTSEDAPVDGPSAVCNCIGYLPMARMSVYEDLGADLAFILGTKSLHLSACLDAAMRVIGFHLIRYMVCRAVEVAEEPAASPFLLDMIGSPDNARISRRSREHFQAHRQLPELAVEQYFKKFENSEEWKQVLRRNMDAPAARALILEKFGYHGEHLSPASEQLAEVRRISIASALAQSGAILPAYGGRIGLITMRRGAGTWYAPNDQFLEALVLANVSAPLDFHEFLASLYRRYSMVIGRQEGIAAYRTLPVPVQDLDKNQARLEERLRMLGLLERKSDAVAFVVNPYLTDGVHAAA